MTDTGRDDSSLRSSPLRGAAFGRVLRRLTLLVEPIDWMSLGFEPHPLNSKTHSPDPWRFGIELYARMAYSS